jgi:outer membrane protein OmpA-like peptidoglycan-associated protein
VAYEIPKVIVLMGVNFATNRAMLTEAARVELDKVVEKLKALPHVRLEVQGHTDITGSRESNIELSQRRAQAVVDYFAEQGIEPARLTARGYGPDRPRHDNETREGRQRNRRIELVRMN